MLSLFQELVLAHIEDILSFMDLFCQQQLDEVSGRWVADLAQMGSLRHLYSQCLTIFFKSWTHLMPKGRLPVMSSKVSTPTAQRSTVSSYFSAEMSSGDRYKGVPQKVPLSSLLGLYTLHPKSVSLISPPGATNMFSGLMSRWIMLFRWRKSTAWQICLTMPCTYFKVKPDLRYYIREYSVFRPAYYWIRQILQGSSKTPCSFTMFTWLQKLWILSYDARRSMTCSSQRPYFYIILRAYITPVLLQTT